MKERESTKPKPTPAPYSNPQYLAARERRDELGLKRAGLERRIAEALAFAKPAAHLVKARAEALVATGEDPGRAEPPDLVALREQHLVMSHAYDLAERRAEDVRRDISIRVQAELAEEWAEMARASYEHAHAHLEAQARQERYLVELRRGGVEVTSLIIDRFGAGMIGPVGSSHLREFHGQISRRSAAVFGGTEHETFRHPGADDEATE